MVQSLNNLSPLALRLVALRVGADGAGRRSRQQTAERLGCHPRFVDRIEAHAMAAIGPEGWSELQLHCDTVSADGASHHDPS